jgi:hypothetical protein
MMSNDKKRDYAVQDPDALWVAGQRVPESRLVSLTEEQARYELLAGTIRLVDPQPGSAPEPRHPAQKVRG